MSEKLWKRWAAVLVIFGSLLVAGPTGFVILVYLAVVVGRGNTNGTTVNGVAPAPEAAAV